MVCLKKPDDFYFIGDFIEISYAIKNCRMTFHAAVSISSLIRLFS
ncbi:hypothetical protein HMPREF0369_00379 [Anaerostipes hadrus ATCC 29173 = JCM 17467]|nr:hypothetical protein HMPREF0369_00379 [Anaerostipes hadrus ATCC 29173 = JCM 17467]